MLNKPQNPKYEKIAGKSAKVRSIMCEMRTCNCPIITCDTCHKLGDDKMQRDHHHHRHHQGHQGHHLQLFLGHRHHHHDPIISCDACQKLVTGCREVGVDFGQCSSTVSTVFGKMFHHCQQYLKKYQQYQSVPSLSLGVYHEIAKNQCIPGN